MTTERAASDRAQPEPAATDDVDDILTTAEVADYLKVGPEAVKRWLRAGELKGSRLGTKAGWRVRRADVLEFLEQRSNKP